LEGDVTRLIVVHNAGTLGRIGAAACGPTDASQLQSDVCLNVTSFIALTEAVLKASVALDEALFVNVSSLAAIKPFPTIGQYSTWKAAREMYMATVGLEARGSGKVRTLSYAPGPMVSDMTSGLSTHPDLDAGLRSYYALLETDVRNSYA
jgi:sepiapterin reductase